MDPRGSKFTHNTYQATCISAILQYSGRIWIFKTRRLTLQGQTDVKVEIAFYTNELKLPKHINKCARNIFKDINPTSLTPRDRRKLQNVRKLQKRSEG